MTLNELGAIGEFVGGITVLVTLIYLAIEVRQSNRLQRASVPLSQAETNVTYADLIVSDPDVARIYAAGMKDMNALEPIDRVRFGTLMLKFWKFMEGQFWAYKLGAIPKGFWKAQSSGALAAYQLPGARQYLSERSGTFSAEFLTFLESGQPEFQPTALRREIDALKS